MANTKVTGDLIASGTITAANLVSGTLDGLLNTYLTTNSYATQSYVTTAVNNLIDAAPASLDTLNELAAALNDDANFATTVTNALATKLNLSGGNITGNLSVDTNVLFVDTANDRVGIGTSSPSAKLHSLSTDSTYSLILDNTISGADQNYLSFKAGATTIGDINRPNATNDIEINSNFGSIAFGTGTSGTASERMRIDSSGRVSIGTNTSIIQKLTIAGSYGRIESRAEDNTNAGAYFTVRNEGTIVGQSSQLVDNSGNWSIYTGGASESERMRITSTGNVGIGTSSPIAKLHISGADTFIRLDDTNGGTSFIGHDSTGAYWRTFSTDTHRFMRATGAESMRITSGGQVQVGTTLGLGGRVLVMNDPTSGVTIFDGFANGNLMLFVNSNAVGIGTITTNGSSTSYNTTSDYRLKENVVEMTGALDRVDALKPSRFNFIADPETTVDGFLAHEVQEIVPEAITGKKDEIDEEGKPVYQGIDQSKLVPLLTSAIQELKDIVDQQQIEIDNLKAQLNG